MEYNSGNYDKYMTRNPLKRTMVSKLNNKILNTVRDAVKGCLVEKGADSANTTIHILDAGCGEGFLSSFLLAELGERNVEITGLEYTLEAIHIAREMNPNIEFIQGDVMKMPFGTDSFDIVLCTEVLEHLPDPVAALAELVRVTKHMLLITVPNEPWFCMGNLLVLKNVRRLGNPIDHINHWTFFGFSSFLKRNSVEQWNMGKSFPWTIARCVVNEGNNRTMQS